MIEFGVILLAIGFVLIAFACVLISALPSVRSSALLKAAIACTVVSMVLTAIHMILWGGTP